MAAKPITADDVKAIVAEREIRFIRFWFTDILGQLKSFSINAAELDAPSSTGWASTAPRSPASTRSRSPT
jgi:glutamine synthetase